MNLNSRVLFILLFVSITGFACAADIADETPEAKAETTGSLTREYRQARDLLGENPAEAESLLKKLAGAETATADYWNDLGIAQLRQKNYGGAETSFKHALTLRPDYFRAHYNLGVLRGRQEQWAAAAQAYRDALKLAPTDPEARYNLAVVLQRGGDLDQAEKEYKTLIGNTRLARFYRAYFNLGVIAAKRGDWKSAAHYYSETTLLRQAFEPAHLNLGVAQVELGQFDQAAASYEKAAKLDPKDYQVPWNQGLLILKRNAKSPDRAATTSYFEQTLKLNPKFAPAAYNLGLAAWHAKDWARADEYFRKAVSIDPKYAEAYYMLGKLATEGGRNPAAIDAYRTAFKLRPTYGEAGFNLALALDRAGNRDESFAVYEQLEKLEPPDPEALNNLGLERMRRGDLAGSRRAFERSLQAKPDYISARYNLGILELRDNHVEKAAALFEAVVKSDPRHHPSWDKLGYIYTKQGRAPESLEAMRKAWTLKPGDNEYARELASRLMQAQAEEEANSVRRKALDAGANDPVLFEGIARAATKNKDNQTAVDYYRKSLQLKPDAKTAYNLGLALRRQQRFDEAEAAYAQAVKLKPDYEKAWLNLGYAQLFQHHFDEAEKSFQQALKVKPDYANAKDGLRDLELARKGQLPAPAENQNRGGSQ